MPEHLRDYEYEVVVLGGGPAGIAAACTAAANGCRVALIESSPWLGGPLWRTLPEASPPRQARQWLRGLERSTVELFDRSTAFGATSPDVLHVERGEEALNVGWHQLILAVGAQELFLPFPGWTLPHVCGVGGLQLLTKTGWPMAGQRVVVAGSGPLSLAAAAYLAQHGARVTDILEQAPWGAIAKFALQLPLLAPAKIAQGAGYQLRLMRSRFRAGCWPLAAEGNEKLESVTFTNGRRTWTRPCDYLACAFGLIPNLQWPRLMGCAIEGDAAVVDDYQRTDRAARLLCRRGNGDRRRRRGTAGRPDRGPCGRGANRCGCSVCLRPATGHAASPPPWRRPIGCVPNSSRSPLTRRSSAAAKT